MPDVQELVRFDAEVTEISADPKGGGADCFSLPDAEVAEMSAGDPDPFFAVLTFVKEGAVGNGKPRPKRYTREAVRTGAKLAPGAQAYLGHRDPAQAGFGYRDPQAKVVRAWVDAVRENGRTVEVARAKAYVSREASKLRTHIRERMAGPVSWIGRAVLKANETGETEVVEILEIHSIDFCNPGTEGVAGAGVYQVVNEQKNGGTMSDPRLTKEQLAAAYGAEIREMARETAEAAARPLEARAKEAEGKAEAAAKEAAQKDADLEVMEQAAEAKDAEIATLKTRVVSLVRETREAALRAHAADLVKGLEDVSEEVRSLLGTRLRVEVLDGDADDLAKSKAAIKAALDKEVAELAKVAEMTGGSLKGAKSPTGAAPGNPARKPSPTAREELSAAILASKRKPESGDGA